MNTFMGDVKEENGGQIVPLGMLGEPQQQQHQEGADSQLLTMEDLRACRKVVPSGTTSQAWEHFKVLADGRFPDRAFCNHCDMVIKRGSASSSSNLFSHLRVHHKELYANEVVDKMESGTFRDKFVKWVSNDVQCLWVGEDDDFREMIRHGGPRVYVPDRHAVAKRLTEIELHVRQNLKQLVKGESVSITIDTWMSESQVPYLAVTSSFINKNWDLVTAALHCDSFAGTHSAEAVSAEVKEILRGYGIPSKSIIACVTDLAPTLRTTGMLVEFDWHGCLAHLLDLVTSTFLNGPGVPEVIQSVRALVGHFQGSAKARDALEMLATAMGVKWKILIPDVAPYWWSTYAMLASVLHLQQPLRGMMASLPTSAKLSEHAWGVITRGVVLLEPFTVAQKMLEGERHVTVSWLPHLLNVLLHSLRKITTDSLSKESLDPSLHDIASIMYEDFIKVFGDGEVSSLPRKIMWAAALDPRTKSLAHLTEFQQDVIWDEISTAAMSKYDAAVANAAMAQSEAENSTPPIELRRMGTPQTPRGVVLNGADVSDDEDDIFEQANGRSTPTQAVVPVQDRSAEMERQQHMERLQHEIKAYRSRAPLIHTAKLPANPLQWWATQQVVFPSLSSLARSLLAVPATAMAMETVFSVGGQLNVAKRNRLSGPSAGQMVFLHGAWKQTEALTTLKGMKRLAENAPGSAGKSSKVKV